MQKNVELHQQLKEAQDGVTAQEALNVSAAAATDEANEKIKKLTEETQRLKEVRKQELFEAPCSVFPSLTFLHRFLERPIRGC